MTKTKGHQNFLCVKMEIFVRKNVIQKFWSAKIFPVPQTRRQVSGSATGCLVLIIVNKYLSSSTSFNTSFDMCSVQLIFSVLRHILISKASNLVMSSFLRIHVSAQYKVALQISVFTFLFLRHLHTSQSCLW